jgi:hypothetical protein
MTRNVCVHIQLLAATLDRDKFAADAPQTPFVTVVVQSKDRVLLCLTDPPASQFWRKLGEQMSMPAEYGDNRQRAPLLNQSIPQRRR